MKVERWVRPTKRECALTTFSLAYCCVFGSFWRGLTMLDVAATAKLQPGLLAIQPEITHEAPRPEEDLP